MKREFKCLWLLTVTEQVSAVGQRLLDIGWQIAFSDKVDHLACGLTRHVATRWHRLHAHGRLTMPMPHTNHVVFPNGMPRFSGAAIQQNKTRVAKLLSNRTTRAKPAQFKKEIEAHKSKAEG